MSILGRRSPRAIRLLTADSSKLQDPLRWSREITTTLPLVSSGRGHLRETPLSLLKLMQIADDKAQALFDNCFEIVSGPDAPDVTIQELENELILYMTNDNPLSNNYREDYLQLDPGIPKFDVEGVPLRYVDTFVRL